jgi:hypothetical protein
MTIPRLSLLTSSCFALLSISAASSASAASYLWDPNLTTTGSDGSGTWGDAIANWASAGSDQLLPSVDTAVAASGVTATGVANGNPSFTVSSTTGLAVGQYVSLTQFPAGSYITGIAGNVVTMSANATGALTTGAASFTTGNTAIFGAGTGAAGTVTLTTTEKAAYMIINPAGSGNYTFTGGTISLGSGTGTSNGLGLIVNSSATINSVLSTKNINFGATGQTLTLGGTGATNLLTIGGTIQGTTAAIGQSSTINLTGTVGSPTTFGNGGAGTTINIGNATALTGGVSVGANATLTSVGSFSVGNGANGLVTVNGGTLALSSSGSAIGRSGTGVGRVILNSGAITIASTANSATDASMRVGFQGGANALVDIKGGTLTAGGFLSINDPFNAGTGGANNVVNINGGTATFGSVLLGGSNSALAATSGSATLNVNSGSLYLGTTNTATMTTPIGTITPNGIVNLGGAGSTATVNLAGGLLGAKADWSSSVGMTLTNTSTLKGADVSDVRHNLTLSGKLTGTGGLQISGGTSGTGTVLLTGPNDYSGGTTILSTGIVATGATGSFGTGNVSLADGILTLGNNTSIADTASLSFTNISGIVLNGGTETIGALLDTTSGVFMSVGTWDAAALNAAFGVTTFSGAGSLNVTAVPEPEVWSLGMVGMLACLLFRRKRRNA